MKTSQISGHLKCSSYLSLILPVTIAVGRRGKKTTPQTAVRQRHFYVLQSYPTIISFCRTIPNLIIDNLNATHFATVILGHSAADKQKYLFQLMTTAAKQTEQNWFSKALLHLSTVVTATSYNRRKYITVLESIQFNCSEKPPVINLLINALI